MNEQQLRDAIKSADSALRIGEGVGLAYYLEDCARYSKEAAEALVVINAVLAEATES